MDKKSQKPPQAKSARHAKSTKKPVTIEAEANEVTSSAKSKAENPKPKPAVDPKRINQRTGSVPKSSGLGRAGTSNETKMSPNQKPHSPSASRQGQSNNGGVFGKLSAGFAGGILALSGAALLQYFSLLPNMAPNNPASSTIIGLEDKSNFLADRIALVEKQLSNLPKGSSVDPIAFEALIDEKLSGLQARAEATQSGGNAALSIQASLDSIKAQVLDLKAGAIKSEAQVMNLQSAVSSGSAGEEAGLTALSNRIDAMTGKIGEIDARSQTDQTQPGDLSALKTSLSSLSSQMNSVLQKTNSIPQNFSDPAITEAQISTLKEQLNASIQRFASLESDITKQNAALETIQSQLENGTDKKAARALAAAAVKADVDRGESYETSLATLKAIMKDPASLAPLEPFAKTGIPTVLVLTQEFESLRDEIASTSIAKPNDDPVSRLLAGAKSLVKIRQINVANDDSVPSTINNISHSLASNRLAESLKHWEKLPEAAKTASKGWMDKVVVRKQIDELLSQTIQNLIAQTKS